MLLEVQWQTDNFHLKMSFTINPKLHMKRLNSLHAIKGEKQEHIKVVQLISPVQFVPAESSSQTPRDLPLRNKSVNHFANSIYPWFRDGEGKQGE